jgi:hypothetical protein
MGESQLVEWQPSISYLSVQVAIEQAHKIGAEVVMLDRPVNVSGTLYFGETGFLSIVLSGLCSIILQILSDLPAGIYEMHPSSNTKSVGRLPSACIVLVPRSTCGNQKSQIPIAHGEATIEKLSGDLL